MANSLSKSLGRRERPVLLSVIGVLIIVVIVQAVAPTLLHDEDPAPTMTIGSATQLVDELSSQGWDCFDSDGDAQLKRCFANDIHEATASVSVLSKDDAVAMIKAEASGSDSDAIDGTLATAVESMDKALLPSGEEPIKGLMNGKAFEAQELPGGVLVETAPSSIKILNGKDGGASASTVYQPKALPLPDQQAFGLEQNGFTCHSEFDTRCDAELDGVDASISQGVRPIDPHMIEVRLDHVDEATTGSQSKASNAQEQLGKILADDAVGLTDTAGAKFLAHDAETGNQGDFAGYEMTVITGVDDDSGSITLEFTSIVPEATPAFAW
ncbi:hypothetical protein [Brevibacterium sp. FAM 24638]|uniref:hypothetical protein n=2 Tax=Brevibacterium TaxID=1696 RepID=UPI00110461AA|nr:hypothetical protein EB835_11060 [Brevibacterium sp. S22]